MKVLDPAAAALQAVAAHATRPATAVIHDSPGVRLVVFRLEQGQEVAPHTSEATVLLSVLSGRGMVSGAGEEREVGPGDVITYAPGELHGMRAGAERFCLVATIARRQA